MTRTGLLAALFLLIASTAQAADTLIVLSIDGFPRRLSVARPHAQPGDAGEKRRACQRHAAQLSGPDFSQSLHPCHRPAARPSRHRGQCDDRPRHRPEVHHDGEDRRRSALVGRRQAAMGLRRGTGRDHRRRRLCRHREEHRWPSPALSRSLARQAPGRRGAAGGAELARPAREPAASIEFLYVSEVDHEGHEHGPDSAETDTALRTVDAAVAR